MRKIFIILTGLLITGQILGQSKAKYAPAEIKQDLEYLYTNLELAHYNLYVNTSKGKFDKAYEKAIASISDSMSLLEVYRIVQPFVAMSELGHCTTDYPYGRLYGNYVMGGGKLFPVDIYAENGKVFVKKSFAKNDSIEADSELLGINNLSAFDYMNNIYKYLAGEGLYIKSTLLDLFLFPRLHWAIEDVADEYHLKVKTKNGKVRNVTLLSIPSMEFEMAMSNAKQLFNTERKLRFIDEIAILTPGTFMNAEGTGNTSDTTTFNKSEFSAFIDSAFSEMQKNKSIDLIIDLRNNSGGDNNFSDEMLSYFANKPFRFCSKYEVKTSKLTKDYWSTVNDPENEKLKEQILAHKDGEIFEVEIPLKMPKPDSLQFTGSVYVLINRYSYSQATVTAAMIQDYKFGTLIGEQTADVPTTFASIHQFELPNTKIAISYPKAFIVRPNGNENLVGTIPDYTVENNRFSEEDKILNFAIKMIKKKGKSE